MIIKKATDNDIDLLMSSRLEMLTVVNNLSDDASFDKDFLDRTKEYFNSPNQTTVLTIDNNVVIGCATICYINIMPTISHPTGKRAHIMNVYTHENYRRQGIALKMLELLIEEAKQMGVTEISLDATELGRPLYEKFGFVRSEEGMVLNIT
ncbi:GNAT family N-acetyltransferase [Anaerosporobacter sp.]